MMDVGSQAGVVALLVFAVLAVACAFKFGEVKCDQWRVRNYISDQGGRLVSSSWSPFGRGWLRSQDARLYAVRYVDREGNTHEATCRTAPLAGVYFTEDRIVARVVPEASEPGEELARLREECARLREENELLKQAMAKGVEKAEDSD